MANELALATGEIISFDSATLNANLNSAFWDVTIELKNREDRDKFLQSENVAFSLKLGDTTWELIADDAPANEVSYSYSVQAQGKTVLLTERHSDPITQTWTETTATAIAQQLCDNAGITLDWQAIDGNVAEFSADNSYPIDIIAELASESGAKLQSTPGGVLQVINWPTVRPSDIDAATPEYKLSTSKNIYGRPSEHRINNKNHDWVLITTDDTSYDVPQVTIESSDDGDDKIAIVRSVPFIADLELKHKSGADLTLYYEGYFSEEVTEQIIVENRVGKLSKEFEELISYEYMGDSAGGISIDTEGNGTTELNELALLSVTYKTRYHRWRCQRANSDVKFALVYVDDQEPVIDGSSIECVYDVKTRQAPPEIMRTIQDLAVMYERGKAVIWPQVYDLMEYQLEVDYPSHPYLPGKIAQVEITAEGKLFNSWIKSVSIIISDTVTQNIPVHRPLK